MKTKIENLNYIISETIKYGREFEMIEAIYKVAFEAKEIPPYYYDFVLDSFNYNKHLGVKNAKTTALKYVLELIVKEADLTA